MKKNLIILGALLALAGCRKPVSDTEKAISTGPNLEDYIYPLALNNDQAILGRSLFYDKQLSHNNSVSCGSCHQQARAFCDNLKSSPGLESALTIRNTPTIFSKSGRLFWDGRAAHAQQLVLMPVRDHIEMGVRDLDQLIAKLEASTGYKRLFEKAFGDQRIDTARIQTAMVEFLKNFNFNNNKFKRHVVEGEALSPSEQFGKDLFFGKAMCSNCHQIEQFLNTPLPGGGNPGGYGGGSSAGPDMAAKNIGLDKNPVDIGVAKVTGLENDKGKFMMPVLLNVEYTFPYMHDARFATLEEVVEHYNSGIQDDPNLDPVLRDWSAFPDVGMHTAFSLADVNKNGMIDADESHKAPPVRLNLSETEKRHLVAFLKTLTDPAIKSDKRFSDPFEAR